MVRTPSSSLCPQPPRNLPAPPEFSRIDRSYTTTGESCSMTSAGTPEMPLGKCGRVQAVLDRARAGAATGKPDVGEWITRLIVTQELKVPDVGGAFGHHPVWNRLCQCAEDGTRQEVAQDVPRRHRRRRQARSGCCAVGHRPSPDGNCLRCWARRVPGRISGHRSCRHGCS